MERYIWRIRPRNTPVIIKNCSKCGKKQPFVCSGNFRINSQQRNLDVWLIYRCSHCDTTWNMDIFSRIKPTDMPPELYYKFEKNDYDTAVHYAYKREVLSQNNAEIDYSSVEYDVIGDDIPADASGTAELVLIPDFMMDQRLDKLLSGKLGISRQTAAKLFDSGAIEVPGVKNAARMKINTETVLKIDLEKFSLMAAKSEVSQ